jgi:hypothetical protein
MLECDISSASSGQIKPQMPVLLEITLYAYKLYFGRERSGPSKLHAVPKSVSSKLSDLGVLLFHRLPFLNDDETWVAHSATIVTTVETCAGVS